MDHDVRYALDAAKEITVAKMTNSTINISKSSGESVAAFYEEIFKRILNLSESKKD